MRLDQLLESVRTVKLSGPTEVEIEGIAYDSRQIKPGWLFVAVGGHLVDGVQFVPDALANGAVAVVSECPLEVGGGICHIQVDSARRALAEIANAYYGNLSQQIKVIGVTGTNGKTTTSYLIRDLLRAGGFVPGLLGTVAYEIGERAIPAPRTTPEAPDIHSMFQQMKESGCNAAVMEVSSHAIDLKRVHGIDFKINVFTNLTQDHLDYHKDMDTYFNVKASLFEQQMAGDRHTAVINIDDPWGRKLVNEKKIDAHVVTYGFHEQADIFASNASVGETGTRFHVATPWGEADVQLQLLGRFNIHNALAALTAGGACGIDVQVMAAALKEIPTIPGRLELVKNRKNRRIFVDYAHTDDALENVLSTLREFCRGKLYVVFGCGGNRDKGKRIKMGRVASKCADFSIVTSDNPRGEDPGQIVADIIKGFDDQERYAVMLDRHEAIERGIRMMGRKDILLVAGKGHESYQDLGGTVIPFDDRDVVREVIG
jgi:UDP-N-acetylmuramoyl-L-alanyl-D-glutamate--2,6-diaminopimelate ligase